MVVSGVKPPMLRLSTAQFGSGLLEVRAIFMLTLFASIVFGYRPMIAHHSGPNLTGLSFLIFELMCIVHSDLQSSLLYELGLFTLFASKYLLVATGAEGMLAVEISMGRAD